jgi:hypothetical protein
MGVVALYIYVDELIDDVLTPIAHRIELFADENISITSSIQQFQDLGAIFTDYSQSFTVPASAHNNKIFKHWYESSVQNGFDHRISYYGYIEIDTIPFRYGKYKLNKANAKDGMIESYSINFVGNLVQLKDRFKEDEIADLQIDGTSAYNELNFYYYDGSMQDILDDDGYPNVRFPLIGNTRRYECGTDSAYDITTTTGKIDVRELFPAIPVSKVIEYIQTAYDLNFSGVFFDSLEFQKLWLYCKNSETFSVKTEPTQVDIFNTTSTDYFNLTTNEMFFKFSNSTSTEIGSLRWRATIVIRPTDNAIAYTLRVFDNGVLYQTYENLIGQQGVIFYEKYIGQEPLINGQQIEHRFTFSVNSDFPMNFSTSFQLVRNEGLPGLGIITANDEFPYSLQGTNSNINIQNYIPKIKVVDFLTAIIKMFNLMIIPTNENSFEFVTLEVWYARGQITNITKHIDKENIDINSPKLFRKVSFIFEQSTNILNNAFRGLFNRYYGDLIYESELSAYTENYEVKLPFENIMFERYPIEISDPITNFLTATCWDKDQKPYVPKPILLYNNGVEELILDDTPTDIKYKFGTTNFQLTNYTRFSNELNIGGTDATQLISNCWSDEVSSWQHSAPYPLGLYRRFYSNYIENLYNQSTRQINYKFKMTTPLLNRLKLNDRVIVSNKRYVINKMTTSLSTKECNIELLNDFRSVVNDDIVNRNTNIQNLVVDNTEQDIELQVYLRDKDLWRSKVAIGFLAGTYLKSNTYTDGILNISVPANTSGVDRQDNILIEYYKGSVSTTISIPFFQYA